MKREGKRKTNVVPNRCVSVVYYVKISLLRKVFYPLLKAGTVVDDDDDKSLKYM